MYPTVKQIFEVIGSDQLTVEAGEEWMDRKMFRGVQSVEGTEISELAEYGDILFTSGIGLENAEEDLLRIFQELENRQVTFVLRIGQNIHQVPESLKLFCQEHEIILLSLDVSVKLQPVIQKLYRLLFQEEDKLQNTEQMMQNLIAGTYNTEEAAQAYRMGLDPGKSFVAVIIMVDDFFKVREQCGEKGFQALQRQICGRMEYIMRIHRRTLQFSLTEKNDIVELIQNEGTYLDRGYIKQLFEEMIADVQKAHKNISISVGIGTPFSQLLEIQRSVTEARRSLQILAACGRRSTIRCYDDIGIYRLLFELQDQEVFRAIKRGILGKLQEFDLENGENLTETLQVYLENDKNIGISAQKMYLHRNTFKYRLNKIEEILLCDLSDSNTCFNLNLAFKIERFLQSEKMFLE